MFFIPLKERKKKYKIKYHKTLKIDSIYLGLFNNNNNNNMEKIIKSAT